MAISEILSDLTAYSILCPAWVGENEDPNRADGNDEQILLKYKASMPIRPLAIATDRNDLDKQQ